MNIKKTQNNASVTYSVEGRLDTSTAPELESALNSALDGISELAQ